MRKIGFIHGLIEEIQAQANPQLFDSLQGLEHKPWPNGDAPSGKAKASGVDETHLAETVDAAFAETSPGQARGTRAVVVVYKGEIIAEEYAEGFGAETRLIGWSMTKSITGALLGILVKEGKLDNMAPAPVPAWHGHGDPRGEITLDMLQRMSSGLEFDEDYYSPFADASPMLFHNFSAAQYAIEKPLQYPVDTKWYYSSGTSNILQEIIRTTLGDDEAYHRFPYEALFSKIGMRSAYLEADSSGTFVGSSFFYATARDYARFGLLYANDGVWDGERILPEGWVEYSRTPTSTDPVGRYGAHWWLPFPYQFEVAKNAGVILPEDTFYAAGHEGQFIYVIPSLELVAVRLGLSGDEDNRFTETLVGILQAIHAE